MLKRLTALTLIYSFFIFSAAGPSLATNTSSNKGERPRSTKKDKNNSCSTCAPKPQSNTLAGAIDRLQGLGRMTQVHVLLPFQRSIRQGVPVNFVSTATGHLSFTINDLSLTGTMPIVFQRFYSSESSEDRGLGKGWSFAFDDRITIDGDAGTLRTGDGSLFVFRDEEHNGRFVLKTFEPSLHQSFHLSGDTVTEQVANLKRIYKKLGNEYRLTEISDSNGNRIRISFDDRRNLKRVEGSAGTLEFVWSDTADSQLLGITDSGDRHVSFKCEQQRLRVVVDADGNEWPYDYSKGRLTKALDPLGRVMLRVSYDQIGRVMEAGDGAGVHTYDYDTASPIVSRRTTVADPLGIATTYEHNNDGALVSVEEKGGRKLLEISYDASIRATRISSRDQGDLSFSFDGKNRLARSTLGDGSSSVFTYDERGRVSSTTSNGIRTDFARDARGNIVSATSADPSQSYRASFDASGRLLVIESTTGRKVTNEYDASGNVTAFTENTGRIRMERDAAGRIRAERFSSGLSVQYERSSRGLVTKKSDINGSLTFERDSSGALIGVVRPDNTWIRATRDQIGRIVALNSSAGKSRRFAYDSRGGLTDYTDSQGRHKRFLYDSRGRLATIIDDEGNRTIIERDEKGGVQRVVSLRIDGRRYYYSRAGQLLAVDRSPGQFNQAAQFVSIGSSIAWPRLRPAIAQEDCIFGLDPSFDATERGGMSCWDPFGDFGGGDSWGGGCDTFDSFGCTSYSGGETYEQCIARQRQICWSRRDSCFNSVFRNYIIALGGCAALTFTNPTGGAICMAAAYLTYINNLTNCDSIYQNCLLGLSDRCRG